jgi:hypothetical protein
VQPRDGQLHHQPAVHCSADGHDTHEADATDNGQRHPARHGQNDPAIPLGRKNALFAGSNAGGERWAILASLINTAKLHAIDPQTYLADVLDRIVSGRTKANALRELLPWEWKAAQVSPTALAA